MPALVNSNVGSLPGTSGLDGTTAWPLERKNSRKSDRIWWLLRRVLGEFMRKPIWGTGTRTGRRTGKKCADASLTASPWADAEHGAPEDAKRSRPSEGSPGGAGTRPFDAPARARRRQANQSS